MFELIATPRILFGCGTLDRLSEVVHGFGRRVLAVTGTNTTRSEAALALLRRAGCHVTTHTVCREPTVQDIEQGIAVARSTATEVVVGLGGGSVLDTAKAVAALLRAPGGLLDYLEVIGHGRAISVEGVACVAVPTTAGTGAEVTRNAVIDVPERAIKVSLRGAQVLPRVAIVDPTLTLTSPADVTAWTGMDALTQVLEPFLSLRANAVTDALAKEGIRLASTALRRVYRDGSDLKAREDMALTSLLGGICLTNAGLGAVHGLAGPLGGVLRAPHGALCAALLANTMAQNLRAFERIGSPGGVDVQARLDDIGRQLTGQSDATAESLMAWLRELTRELGIAGLAKWGLKRDQFSNVIDCAQRASSMKYNPVPLDADSLSEILESSL